VLAAAHLARDDNARGKMRQAHGGLHLVHVLAALAAGTKRIELDVFGIDVHFNAVVHFRNDEDRGKGSVATRRLIEGRNAHQAVHAGFAGQQTVGILSAELNRSAFDARFFARRFIQKIRRESSAFRHRKYMRSRMEAQSCDSVPPAPGLMVMMALR